MTTVPSALKSIDTQWIESEIDRIEQIIMRRIRVSEEDYPVCAMYFRALVMIKCCVLEDPRTFAEERLRNLLDNSYLVPELSRFRTPIKVPYTYK